MAEEKSPKVSNNQKKLEELTKIGIEVHKATFHAAVSNIDGIPSTHYNVKSDNAARRAIMWLCPNVFVFKQGEKYFSTSLSNYIEAHFKE